MRHTAPRTPYAPAWAWLAGLLGALAVVQPAAAAPAGTVLQAIGSATVDGSPVQPGSAVQPQQQLQTLGDGYLYIQTADGGLLILRPNTTARILEYQADPAQPAQTRVRIELQDGVARSVTGQAVKAARDRYRLNTPIAAIGVRGTDFTVATTADVTRVAVHSGGVQVAGFDALCTPDTLGPCDTPNARSLYAGLPDAVLQVLRDQPVPQILKGKAPGPDPLAPPGPGEPAAAAPNALSVRTEALVAATLDPQALPKPKPEANPLVWGRWQEWAGAAADINLSQARAGRQLLALNPVYVLLRDAAYEPVLPTVGKADFSLVAGGGYALAEGGGAQPLGLSGGALTLDWAQRSFQTQLNASIGGAAIPLVARGRVFAGGTFENAGLWDAPGNMQVQGALGGAALSHAAYLFQARLPSVGQGGTTLYGVAQWQR